MSAQNVDSHRRLELAAQFQVEDLVIIGLQDTRLRIARAGPIGPYRICVAPATKNVGKVAGSYGYSKRGLRPAAQSLVLRAEHKLLRVRLMMGVGPVHV